MIVASGVFVCGYSSRMCVIIISKAKAKHVENLTRGKAKQSKKKELSSRQSDVPRFSFHSLLIFDYTFSVLRFLALFAALAGF